MIKDLIGKTLSNIKVSKDKDEIIFTTNDGKKYRMYHSQDCCESVYVEDVVGDLDDLIGSPILKASEDTSQENKKEDSDDSFTWTFYNISTIKGTITIRWYGESNGYYSESVDFEEINESN